MTCRAHGSCLGWLYKGPWLVLAGPFLFFLAQTDVETTTLPLYRGSISDSFRLGEVLADHCKLANEWVQSVMNPKKFDMAQVSSASLQQKWKYGSYKNLKKMSRNVKLSV